MMEKGFDFIKRVFFRLFGNINSYHLFCRYCRRTCTGLSMQIGILARSVEFMFVTAVFQGSNPDATYDKFLHKIDDQGCFSIILPAQNMYHFHDEKVLIVRKADCICFQFVLNKCGFTILDPELQGAHLIRYSA